MTTSSCLSLLASTRSRGCQCTSVYACTRTHKHIDIYIDIIHDPQSTRLHEFTKHGSEELQRESKKRTPVTLREFLLLQSVLWMVPVTLQRLTEAPGISSRVTNGRKPRAATRKALPLSLCQHAREHAASCRARPSACPRDIRTTPWHDITP